MPAAWNDLAQLVSDEIGWVYARIRQLYLTDASRTEMIMATGAPCLRRAVYDQTYRARLEKP